MALVPGSSEYIYNLGIALKENGRFEDALSAFRKAQQMAGGHVRAALHESLLELLTGDLAAGWRHYESRWAQPDAKEVRHFAQPLWTGQDIAGKTILVHAEQGFGDTFQFLRYLPLLAARGAKVLLVGMQVPPNYGTDYANKFAGVFATVAQTQKAAVVPFLLKGVADGPDPTRLFQPDRIHPRAEAHPQMLANVWPELKKLLR